MQKQPCATYRLQYAPIQLPADFPITGGKPYAQKDRPITFLHLHDHLELGYCFEGSGVFVVEGKVLPFTAGDVSVINRTEMHLARSAAGTVSQWSFLILDPARLVPAPLEEQEYLRTDPFAGRSFRNILRPAGHPGMGERVRSIILELRARKPGYRSAVRARVWEVMVRLHREAKPRRTIPVAGSRRTAMERVAPALEHVAAHYDAPMRMQQLAQLCHTSLTHFRRLMESAAGMSPLEYVTHLRLQMATTLLTETNDRALDIATNTGFTTLSSFNRHFKKQLGMSPREWRKRGARIDRRLAKGMAS